MKVGACVFFCFFNSHFSLSIEDRTTDEHQVQNSLTTELRAEPGLLQTKTRENLFLTSKLTSQPITSQPITSQPTTPLNLDSNYYAELVRNARGTANINELTCRPVPIKLRASILQTIAHVLNQLSKKHAEKYGEYVITSLDSVFECRCFGVLQMPPDNMMNYIREVIKNAPVSAKIKRSVLYNNLNISARECRRKK